MKEEVYKTDLQKTGIMLLPTPLRKPGIAAVLNVLTWVFAEIMDTLRKYRDNTFTHIKYNGQVCRLELCLNNMFNIENQEPGITVTDGQHLTEDPFYLYPRGYSLSIDMPVLLNSGDRHIILNSREKNSEIRYDFIVTVPAEIPINDAKTNQLKSVVNTLKAPGKNWMLMHNS